LDVSDFGHASFGAMLAGNLLSNIGSDVKIQFDGDDSVTLLGVQINNLHQDDFVF
jgi:hypothetical protein